MGSEVVDGYECKPKNLDLNKPIMEHNAIIYVCVDERCAKAGNKNKANELREILKEINLHKGSKRIKISRSLCQGACRYRQVGVIYDKNGTNNHTWLKQIHKFTKNDWIKIFFDIANDKELQNISKIEKKIYE